MGIKRIVDTSFWTDGKVDDFSPEDKYFMLYLLTNPFSTQLGIYEISIKQVAFQLGYSLDAVKVLLDRFENKYGIILYSPETTEIAIKNFLCHSIVKGGAPVRDCLIKEMKAVKAKHLIADVFAHIQKRPNYEETVNITVRNIISDFWERGIDLPFCNGRYGDESCNESCNESYDNENENENDNDNDNDIYISIVEYLNEKSGRNFKPSIAKTKSVINARIKEGFTLDDFKIVIDKKCADWMGKDYEKYIRPQTLFGTKFEAYLNERKTERSGNNGQASGNNGTVGKIGNYI